MHHREQPKPNGPTGAIRRRFAGELEHCLRSLAVCIALPGLATIHEFSIPLYSSPLVRAQQKGKPLWHASEAGRKCRPAPTWLRAGRRWAACSCLWGSSSCIGVSGFVCVHLWRLFPRPWRLLPRWAQLVLSPAGAALALVCFWS